jgi:putative molybdopterin biosynthesis protein
VKQEQFLDVLAPSAARARWHALLDLAPLEAESVALADALGRVLATDLAPAGDVPAFDRSNVDGWAVRAEDTFGADEARPALLRPAAEPVSAGRAPQGEVGAGETIAVATGAVVPRGADAVVMVEDTELDADGRVRVTRPAVPGARISAAGSDMTRGEVILRAGTRLTARETGTLAACGFDRVPCVRRPRVAVISTGDEIVPPGADLAPGQVHDANATLVVDAVREIGAQAESLGIVGDDETRMTAALLDALDRYDVVLLSGGTSKGEGDVTQRAVAAHCDVAAHGVALKPGKPLCLAAKGGKAVAILPGFPTSAIFTFHAFVAPVLRRRLGLRERARATVHARLPRRTTSEGGRAEFNLVGLVRGRDGLVAFPLGKGSGSVTTFAKADGFFEVPADTEYVDAGELVEVTLLGRDVEPADLVVVGSHCIGLDLIVGRLAADGLAVKTLSVGSGGGLDAARHGACDVAPVHLYDGATGTYNTVHASESLRLLRGYGRRQGLAYRPADAARFGADGMAEGAIDAVRRAAADPALRLANRNPSSGTHALVVRLLGDGVRPPGWHTAYRTHGGVASAVAAGRADWGVCLERSARAAGLAWRPLEDEQYDFLVPVERWDAPGVQALRHALAHPATRAALRDLGFDA